MVSWVKPSRPKVDASCHRIDLCAKSWVAAMQIHFWGLFWYRFHTYTTHLTLTHIWLLLWLFCYGVELNCLLDGLLPLCYLSYIHVQVLVNLLLLQNFSSMMSHLTRYVLCVLCRITNSKGLLSLLLKLLFKRQERREKKIWHLNHVFANNAFLGLNLFA